MKTRDTTNMDQKIDELKSYIEDQYSSQGKKFKQICGHFFEKFKKQVILQFTNKTRKESKGIEELESDSTIAQN